MTTELCLSSFFGEVPAHAPRQSERLLGAVAIVYGAGSSSESLGVGQAAALAYALAGAKVVLVDVRRESAARTAEMLSQLGAGCLPVVADVTDAVSVAQATDRAISMFGAIDILHNSVGAPHLADFPKLSDADWLRAMQLNCIGAANTIRCTLPHLVKSGHGVITNISSIAAIRHTGMNYAAYNASKAALNQLTVAVALEYASRGVRANAILPGLLDTGMGRNLAAASQNAPSARDERSPTGRQGDAWDVANAAVFLATRDARYINGHLLVIDGGLSARC